MWNQKSLKIFTKQRGTLIKNDPNFVCVVLTSVVRRLRQPFVCQTELIFCFYIRTYFNLCMRYRISRWLPEAFGRWAIDRPNAEVGPCLTQSINERQTRTDTPTSGVLKHTGRVEVCSIVWQNLTEPVGQVRRLYVCRTETNVDYNLGRCGVQ